MGVDGNVLSYNLYAYCLNNPVNRFDVSGHWSVSSLFASLAVAAVAVAVVAVCVASAGTAAPALLAVGGAVLSSGSVVATASTVAVAAATTAVACSAVGAAVAVNERRHSQTYSVYFLEDGSGTIRYVGRVTDTGYDSRMSYHKRTKGLTPAKRVSGLSYEEARGLEEIGMAECHTLNPGQSGNNQIRGISPVNPKGDLYMSNAMSYLENRAEQWLLNLLQ